MFRSIFARVVGNRPEDAPVGPLPTASEAREKYKEQRVRRIAQDKARSDQIDAENERRRKDEFEKCKQKIFAALAAGEGSVYCSSNLDDRYIDELGSGGWKARRVTCDWGEVWESHVLVEWTE